MILTLLNRINSVPARYGLVSEKLNGKFHRMNHTRYLSKENALESVMYYTESILVKPQLVTYKGNHASQITTNSTIF